MKHQPL